MNPTPALQEDLNPLRPWRPLGSLSPDARRKLSVFFHTHACGHATTYTSYHTRQTVRKKSAPCDKLRPRQKAYPHFFSSCPKMQAWSPQASSEGLCRGRLMGYPQGREERNGTTNSKTRVHSWCALNVGLGPKFPFRTEAGQAEGYRARSVAAISVVGWDMGRPGQYGSRAHVDAGVGSPGRAMSTVTNRHVQLDPQASSGHPIHFRGERNGELARGRCGPAFGRMQWASAGPR